MPEGDVWQFEPKWDGFRSLAFRDGDEVRLMSKAGKPFGRFFPDVEEMLLRLKAARFVLDSEIVISRHDHLSFGSVQARLHLAASRIAKLARETPADLILFDCFFDGNNQTDEPFSILYGLPSIMLTK